MEGKGQVEERQRKQLCLVLAARGRLRAISDQAHFNLKYSGMHAAQDPNGRIPRACSAGAST